MSRIPALRQNIFCIVCICNNKPQSAAPHFVRIRKNQAVFGKKSKISLTKNAKCDIIGAYKVYAHQSASLRIKWIFRQSTRKGVTQSYRGLILSQPVARSVLLQGGVFRLEKGSLFHWMRKERGTRREVKDNSSANGRQYREKRH